jgi:hypothetical protein
MRRRPTLYRSRELGAKDQSVASRTDMPLVAAAVQEVIAVIRMETRTPGSSTPSLAT